MATPAADRLPIPVLDLSRNIVGHAATAAEARAILTPVTAVAGASFSRMERVQLAADNPKNPGLLCWRPHYRMA